MNGFLQFVNNSFSWKLLGFKVLNIAFENLNWTQTFICMGENWTNLVVPGVYICLKNHPPPLLKIIPPPLKVRIVRYTAGIGKNELFLDENK